MGLFSGVPTLRLLFVSEIWFCFVSFFGGWGDEDIGGKVFSELTLSLLVTDHG